jgi:hypothetical protein
LGGGAGIRNELFRYSQIIPTHDTTNADTASWKKHNNVLTGKLYNDIGDKFRWIAYGEFFLTGTGQEILILTEKLPKFFSLTRAI